MSYFVIIFYYSSYCPIKVPGLAENRPSVLRGDRLFVCPVPANGKKYEGYVHTVTLTELFLGFSRGYVANYIHVD